MSIVANIVASRTSGIWPLAIHFDATATASSNTTDEWREVFYYWHFGDSGASGTNPFTYGWDATRTKNVAYGPLAAHVFDNTPNENPASPLDKTYTVTLYVYDGVEWDSDTVTITAYDPWGANGYTSCYVVNPAADSDFSLAPSSSAFCTVTQQNTSSWTTIIGYMATGRRVLVKKGGTYTNTITSDGPNVIYANMDGPWSFEAYGSGTNPIILNGITAGAPIPIHSNSASGLDDGRYIGFRLTNNGQTGTVAIGKDVPYVPADGWTHMLLQDLVCTDEWSSGFWPYRCTNIFLVDCYVWAHEFSMLAQGDSGSRALINSALLGNYWRQDATTDVGGGNVRCGGFTKLVFSNNLIDGGCPGRQHIKFHTVAGGTAQYLLGSENKIIGGGVSGEAWPVDIAPTDIDASETITSFIWENNWQVTGPFNERFIMVHASTGVVRNNLFDSSATDATGIVSRGIVVTSWGPGSGTADPDDVQVYNNTLYSSGTNTLTDPDQGFWLVNVDITGGGATNITVTNNYGSAPNFSKVGTVYDPNSRATSSNNTVTSSPGWVSGTPTIPSHFKLQSSSAARGAGATKPVRADFFNIKRPQGATYDQGFAEFSEGSLFPWETSPTVSYRLRPSMML